MNWKLSCELSLQLFFDQWNHWFWINIQNRCNFSEFYWYVLIKTGVIITIICTVWIAKWPAFIWTSFIEFSLTVNSSIIYAYFSFRADNMSFIFSAKWKTRKRKKCTHIQRIDVGIKYLCVACYAVNMHNPIFCVLHDTASPFSPLHVIAGHVYLTRRCLLSAQHR